MDFIFMLTRQDRTISDCLELFRLVRPLGLKHVGFKDVGVPPATLAALNQAIQASGATSYMEVVSTTPETCLNSARVAAELGVDCLLGGTDVAAVQEILAGSKLRTFPFPGFPRGHPTKLAGTPNDVEAHCRAFVDKGCAGADLLAYRATEADPLALIRAAKKGLGSKRLIVAGSIAAKAQIKAIAEAGADAFTIGSAVFDGSYAPDMGALASQLAAVQADCAAVAA
ncbi:hypothetical protein [Dongia sedimenti]|uniref:4-hydroxythreonine-4-phosphate dehydrogenase n=1 Tax=Dongia sedimenti TaxID=3064282 RepID=A0ABU0YUH9_9PROT|nr:hypothetical protein [Rhodospirillaceae bacterium R-7]